MTESSPEGIIYCAKNRRTNSFSKNSESYSVFVYSIPCVLSILCYSNILKGDFVHDDVFAIQKNRDVTGEGNFLELWRHDYWGKPMADPESHKSYRPLTILTFRLDYYLSEGQSTWFHVVNTSLHGTVTCLLAHVCMSVVHMSLLATLLTSCLFAVHPVHTEAVSGIVGRADLLAAVFFLLSFTAYSRCIDLQKDSGTDVHLCQHGNSRRQLPVSGNSFLLLSSLALAVVASLCKETGLSVLGVCFLFDVLKHARLVMGLDARRPNSIKRMIFRLMALAFTGIVFLIFRLYIMNFQVPTFKHEDNPASFSTSFITRALTFNYLLAVNVWLLLCPRILCYDWQVGSVPLLETPADPRNFGTAVFYVIALCLVRHCWRGIIRHPANTTDQHPSPKDQESDHVYTLSMAVVLMTVPFVPASNLFFRVGFVVAERVLYIPSIGFCILISIGTIRLCESRPSLKGHVLTFAFLLIAVLGCRTWQRNPVWMSRKTLFWSGLSTHPNNAKVHFNMANLYKDEGSMEDAAKHYRTAIALYPHHPSYHNNLGTVLTNETEAEYHFQTALRLCPHHKRALVNLGNLLLSQKNNEGLQLIDLALEQDPRFIDAILAKGKALLSENKFREAESYIQKAIRLQPSQPDAHSYYGYLFHQTGRLDEAVEEFQQAFTLNSRNTLAMKNAAISLRTLHRYSEAEVLLKRALALKSGDSDLYHQLGILYSETGQKQNALSAYRDAMTSSPNNTVLHLRYIQALTEAGRHREANQSLQTLLRRESHDLDVLRMAASLSRRHGKLNEAFHFLTEAIRYAKLQGDPSLGRLHQEKANIYRRWSDLDSSLKHYKLSVEFDSSLVDSFINIGTIYHIKKNYSQAKKFYQKALALDPLNALAKSNIDKLNNSFKDTEGHLTV